MSQNTTFSAAADAIVLCIGLAGLKGRSACVKAAVLTLPVNCFASMSAPICLLPTKNDRERTLYNAAGSFMLWP